MMKSTLLGLVLFGIVACSHTASTGTLPPGPSGESAFTRSSSVGYTTVLSFNGADGSNPLASLIPVNGVLYGTASNGGAYGHGTVFSVNSSGAESLLHSFKGNPNDGAYPAAALVVLHGSLYGTTLRGGSGPCSNGCGTIFKMSTSGKERVLSKHGKIEQPDGLLPVKGTLYATASFGPGSSKGAVYSVTTAGAVSLLHAFKGYPTDGAFPDAPMIVANGLMYGTTSEGGADKNGTVFSITTTGTEKPLAGYQVGRQPEDELLDLNGTLYGTTERGGGGICRSNPEHGGNGCGTVFEVSTSGAQSVIYNFQGKSDGANPVAGLTALNGTLYGTTLRGGAYGAGTVFSISTSGSEQILHSFGAPNDGKNPSGGLLDVNGTLYGTTMSGGSSGNGTVFALTP